MVWENVGHTNWWRLKTGREDQPLAHPTLLAVGDEPETAEVDLELDARRRVVDPHRDGAPAGPAALDGEAGQGAGRDDHTTAGEQDPDLGDGEVFLHPRLDLLLFGEQHPPCLAVAVGAVRADPLDHLADQLVGELLLAAGAVDPELDGGGDVAPGRLAIDADPWAMGRSPSPLSQRRSASLTWTTDTSLNAMGPPRRRRERPSRMSLRPASVDPQGGPITGKAGWSHVTGKTSG